MSEFKMLRVITPGTATLKRFLRNHGRLSLYTPTVWRGLSIVEWIQTSFGKVRPRSIFRGWCSNKKLKNKQPTRQAVSSPSSATATPREDLLQNLLESIIGHRSQSTSPPAERRPRSQSGGGEQAQTSPTQRPPPLALGDIGAGSKDAIVVTGGSEVEPPKGRGGRGCIESDQTYTS